MASAPSSAFKRRATKIIFPNSSIHSQSHHQPGGRPTLHPRSRFPQAHHVPATDAVGKQSSTMLPVGKPPQSNTNLGRQTMPITNPIPPLNSSRPNSMENLNERDRQIRKLRQMRSWESTTLGHLVGEAGPNSAVGDGTRFVLLSYNILAQVHLDGHQYLYRDCDPQALDWDYRLSLLMAEIEELRPSIICLQEVEALQYYTTFEPDLAFFGYKGAFKKRTREKPDGCAIFWKNEIFALEAKLGIDYYQPHVKLLDRDNIGLLVKLRARSGKRSKLVIGTTHLLYNPRRNDIRLAQVQLLLAEMERFACSGYNLAGEPQYCSTIICGDFNTEPYSSILRLVTDGQLQYVDPSGQRPKLLLNRGMNDFLPDYVGISDQCQHYRILLERFRQWKKHRRNNFELDLKIQHPLINLHSTEKHGEFTGQVPPQSVIDLGSARSSGSGLSRLAANFQSGATADDSEDNLSIHSTNTVMSTAATGTLPSHLRFEIDPQEHAKILDDIYKSGTVCTFGSGELSHNLRMKSVYAPKLDRQENNDNVATTKQTAWTCADYIFYGMQWNEREGRRVEGNLKLLRRLGLLTRNQCKELGSLPTLASPSDHYPLAAEFLLK